MWTRPGAAALALCLLPVGGPGRAEAPLSAIDWLSESVAAPAAAPAGRPDEPPVTDGALTEDIAVTVIDGPSPDATGLLAPSVTGLPRNLWGLGRTDEIVAQIASERGDALPALQALLTTLMLAEAEPPADSAGRGLLLLARIDKLLAMGALEQAAALLDAAGSTEPEVFRRTFDVALLMGTEDSACTTMRATPQIAPTFPARVFCLARSGDWNAAALTLRTAQALGYVSDEEDALLSRFLDPDLYEEEPPLAKPARPTPLVWRMFEAIGEPVPTNTLPVAFAQAELRDTAGWKAQVEAAERLARRGAIAPNRLFGLYTDRKPAASGGVWDRVTAVQALDAGLSAGDATLVAQLLPQVWAEMAAAELEVPFATFFAPRLETLALEGPAAALAFRIGLLAPGYEAVASDHDPGDVTEAFLCGLALGRIDGLAPPDSLARAIAPAFLDPRLGSESLRLIEEGRIGEAILRGIDLIGLGLQGDLPRMTEGLALLRTVGLEDAARRTALELMLLERRG
jgi:hypothetical protein